MASTFDEPIVGAVIAPGGITIKNTGTKSLTFKWGDQIEDVSKGDEMKLSPSDDTYYAYPTNDEETIIASINHRNATGFTFKGGKQVSGAKFSIQIDLKA